MFQKIHRWRNSTKVGAAVFVLLFITLAVSTYQVTRSRFDADAYSLLNQKWAAMKGYVRIDNNPLTARSNLLWYYDLKDPEEVELVKELRDVYLAARANGAVVEISHTAQQLGLNSPAEIKTGVQRMLNANAVSAASWTRQKDPHGTPYLVRAGIIFDEARQVPFYIALGIPVGRSNDFLWSFSRNLCAIALCAFFAGWCVAHVGKSEAQ